MKRKRIGSAYLAMAMTVYLAASAGRARAQDELVLVDDQRAGCTIVVGREDENARVHTMAHSDLTRALPAQVLHDAAQDLAWHLNEMGRVWDERLRVKAVSDLAQARTPVRILLGSAAVEAHGLRDEAAALPYPAYIIRVVGNDLLIFGSSSKGAANGVYGFLQNELGVRWFGPQELFRVIPDTPRIAVGRLDRRVVPSFPGRLVHTGGHVGGPVFEWGRRRMRLVETVDEGEPFRNTSHNLWRILPPARYAEAHPEYYALRHGKRQAVDSKSRNFGICCSNPDVIAIATEAALRYFRADPRRHTFSLGINDGQVYCECPKCTALQPPRTFRGKRVASDMYYHFVNEVARRVAREFPDKYLGTIAYNDVTLPPRGAVESNVHVVLVNDISEYYDSDYRARDEELVQAWEAKGITLGLYYYTQLAKLVPACFPRLLAHELKDKHARGFTSVTSEMGNGWPWHGPMPYVEARLLWDVDLSVDDLLDEYFDLLYGPAARPMQELYALFETIHRRPRDGGFLYEHYNFKQFRPYTGDDLTRMRSLLADAHAAAGGLSVTTASPGLEGRRVAYVSTGLKVFLDMLEGIELADKLDAVADPDDVDALDMLETVERLNTLMDRHERVYRETIINDTTLPGRFRRDTCTPVRDRWKQHIANAAGDALVRLYRRNKQPDAFDPRVAARLEKDVARTLADPYRAVLFRYKTGELVPGPNRVVNPGFEIVDREFSFPDDLDWTASDAMGWVTWQFVPGTGAFEIADRTSRSGDRAGLMRGIGKGCFMTVVPDVQPGEMYHFQVHVLNTAHVTREDKPWVRMEVRWLDANDRWTRRDVQFRQDTARLDEWVPLEAIARVPDEAAQAVIMITAMSLYDDESIFVDDVSFRRLGEEGTAGQ